MSDTPKKKVTRKSKRGGKPHVTDRVKGVDVLEGHVGTRKTETIAVEKWVPGPEIFDRVSELLARRFTLSQCRAYIREYASKEMEEHFEDLRSATGIDYQVWPVPSETSNHIIQTARQMVLDRANLDKPYEQSLAISFYESVIRDPNSTFTEKLKAQDSIRAMIGIGEDHSKNHESSDTVAAKLRSLIGAAMGTVD